MGCCSSLGCNRGGVKASQSLKEPLGPPRCCRGPSNGALHKLVSQLLLHGGRGRWRWAQPLLWVLQLLVFPFLGSTSPMDVGSHEWIGKLGDKSRDGSWAGPT